VSGNVCPCCGYTGLISRAYEKLVRVPVPLGVDPPYAAHFGRPSYEVCDCCGFEFGNDDEPGTGTPATFADYLSEWVAKGQSGFARISGPLVGP
jgi:hypothetical protein